MAKVTGFSPNYIKVGGLEGEQHVIYTLSEVGTSARTTI